MENWPLPNLRQFDFNPARDRRGHWKEEEFNDLYPKNKPVLTFDFPKGWGNPWPPLPDPDDNHNEYNFNTINLNNNRKPCENKNLLGYYMSWHIVGVSFLNENGRSPRSGEELRQYNNSLPEVNRFGIHICCKTIENYINRFSTEGLSEKQIPQYLHYCTYLTMLYVIAHEWGHYRSEVLSFQIGKLIRSTTGEADSASAPSYLSYFAFKKNYVTTNFEEVFAEWTSLKMGIFNYHMQKPDFANNIANWPVIEATVRFMLTEVISRPSRNRPYSDIRFWVDFASLTSDEIMSRLSNNKKSVNRSVNENVLIQDVRSMNNN